MGALGCLLFLGRRRRKVLGALSCLRLFGRQRRSGLLALGNQPSAGLGKEREVDPEAWKKLPSKQVHEASTALLRKNTQGLIAAGAKSVKTFVK